MIAFLLAYKYVFLFLGMFTAGEIVYLPAIYLVVNDQLAFWPVYLVSLAATMLSDAMWFYFGRYFSLEKIRRWHFFTPRKDQLSRFQERFRQYGLRMLFLSKFVYGTRILTQLLAGSSEIPFGAYLGVNTTAAALWFWLIYVIGWLLEGSLDQLQNAVYRDEWLFALFIALVIGLHLWVSQGIKKRWSARSSRPTKKNRPSPR